MLYQPTATGVTAAASISPAASAAIISLSNTNGVVSIPRLPSVIEASEPIITPTRCPAANSANDPTLDSPPAAPTTPPRQYSREKPQPPPTRPPLLGLPS